MPRPSDPVLALLRDLIRKKGLTTAQIAQRLGVERSVLKHQLSGAEPLTVDEFIQLSQVLELSPDQLGLGPTPELPPPPAEPPPGEPDALGNLPRQVVQLGFTLGIDMFLLLDAGRLGGSGIPPAVLSRFPDALPIKLEAKHHRHNKPRFLDDHFECVLSFDRLYTCSFPWPAFRQVHFTLPEEAPEPPPPPKPAGPFLRVVK